jgi:NADH:ubiquinone reductase (H+-translocating)
VPHVLVLGGGYVGCGVARELAPLVKQGTIDVTVVSRENFHSFHGFIGEMLTGRIAPGHMLSPARRIFSPAQSHIAEIERLDLEAKKVVASRRVDGRRTELTWDHLVLAFGITDRLDVYPGLEEHAFRLKTYPDAFRLRNHILHMFELAEVERDDEERRRLLTFFIAGGGFAGTEVAGELADFGRLLTKREYPRIDRSEVRVVLVEPGGTIVPEMSQQRPRLIEKAMARQRELGVEVRLNTLVEAVSPNEVKLSTGERVPTRTVISAVGTKPNPHVERLEVEKDERGRIVVDPELRVPGLENVWAGGDCAAVPRGPGGETFPPMGIHALGHGRHIGHNVAAAINGAAPTPIGANRKPEGASIGRRYGIAAIGRFELSGLPAWLIWRALLTYHLPSRDRRLRMLADWLIWPLVGRDVVEMRVDRPSDYEVQQNRFQEGEEIAAEGYSTRYVHVIVEGEVDLVEVGRDGTGDRVLKTLGPGDQFGVHWIESFEPEKAFAKTEVRTIALRRDQAPRLQEVLRSAEKLIAHSGHFPAIPPDMERPRE